MEVRHERPDPDLSFRLRAPLTLGLPDGSSLSVQEWSLAGFHCPDLEGKPLDGLMLSIPFQGVGVFFPVKVIPAEDEGEFLWQGLTGRQRETLALFYRNLMSGRMTSTQEMIISLDTPVDLVPMEETAPEREASKAKVAPRPLRVLSSLITYSVMFVLVFGFLVYVAMDRLNRVPVISAKVATTSVPLIAQTPGTVIGTLTAPGVVVEEGTPLLQIEDAAQRLALQEAAQQVTIFTERVTQAIARLESHMAGRQNARATFRGGLDRFDAGVSLEPGDFHDLRKRLEADLAAAQADLLLAETRSEGLQTQAEAMILRAPSRGAVLNYRTPLQGVVAQGERLAVFEFDAPRAVLAWVDPEQIAAVWPGMRATVRFNRNGVIYTIQARVAGLTMQGEGTDALVRLSLTLLGMEAGETRAWLEPEIPVEVQLRTDRLRRWLGLGLSDDA